MFSRLGECFCENEKIDSLEIAGREQRNLRNVVVVTAGQTLGCWYDQEYKTSSKFTWTWRVQIFLDQTFWFPIFTITPTPNHWNDWQKSEGRFDACVKSSLEHILSPIMTSTNYNLRVAVGSFSDNELIRKICTQHTVYVQNNNVSQNPTLYLCRPLCTRACNPIQLLSTRYYC